MSEKAARNYLIGSGLLLGILALLCLGEGLVIGAVIAAAVFLLLHPLLRAAVVLTQIRNMQAPAPPASARHHP